jgi:LacI family transcriptional regulator
MTDAQPRKRRPTQADVARLAAVSRPVVSYVLSGDPLVPVAQETRRRVLAAIAELGYVPDHSARSLRRGKTSTIAAIIPDITNPFYPAFIRGIQDIAEGHGFDVIAYNTDGEIEKERKGLRAALAGRADGIIITPFRVPHDELEAIVAHGTAVVTLGQRVQPPRTLPVDNLFVDNAAAARAAVAYLIERGHRRIGMVAGKEGTPPRDMRVRGYAEALAQRGETVDRLLVRAGDFTVDAGRLAAAELLRLPEPPTAIFAANDLMAMGAMFAARAAGFRIPDNLAVVGLDDIPAAALVEPPLTTIAQYPAQLGRRAAELMFDRLNGAAPAESRQIEMPFTLIVRGSA